MWNHLVLYDTCRTIFVTTNAELAKIVNQFLGNSGDSIAPIFIPDDVFATHAWLKQPKIAPDLPPKRLIVDCYAAINPSDELWAKYTNEIKRLQNSNKVSPEDYHILRYSSVAQNILMDVTHGERTAFVEGTVEQVLEEAKRAIRSDLLAEVKAHRQARMEAEYSAGNARRYAQIYENRMREFSIRIGKWVAKGGRILLAFVLVICLYLTFPDVLNVRERGISSGLCLFVLLLSFSLLIFVNMLWGVTIKSVCRRIETWVTQETQKILHKWFSP